MHQRCLTVILALVALSFVAGAHGSPEMSSFGPQGIVFERIDGTYGYVVGDDSKGLWQVAAGEPQLWLEVMGLNADLPDPNHIEPGYELTVPKAVYDLLIETGEVTISIPPYEPSQDFMPVPDDVPPVQSTEKGGNATGLLWLLALALACAIVWLLVRQRRQRRAWDRQRDRTSEAHRTELGQERRQRRELEEADEQRTLANPYSGPPVVEGGLPTVEAARDHFAQHYHATRDGMTVAASRELPESVRIVSIDPVEVTGEMAVRFADADTPERKVLETWEPAWQCTLDDGTILISLWFCGNDVLAGNGYGILPETQIRPRQDVPSYVPETPVGIWPQIEDPDEADAASEEAPRLYRKVTVKSPTAWVLHPVDGEPENIGLSVLEDGLLTFAIEGDLLYAIVNDERVLRGRIVGDAQTGDPSDNGAERPESAAEVVES